MNAEVLATELPDRSGEDIPVQVRYILSVAEAATGWSEWQREHHDEPRAYFCSGLLDYWYDDELDEPTWEMIFLTDLHSGELYGLSSYERFCYQQGAIVGYQLREKYGRTD